jgi:RNA polymerase sigma factor (sigma-70 family)
METLQKSNNATTEGKESQAKQAHPPIQQNEPRPEILPYATTFIQRKAQQLVGKYGVRPYDRPDIEQEIYLDLCERLDKFDSEKATLNTFVQRVVENKIADLIRERGSNKTMAERATASLSTQIGEDPDTGQVITMADCITNEQYDEFVRNRTCSRMEEQDMAMDLQEVLSKLPEYLRRPCKLLMEGRTIAETAREVNMKQASFYEQVLEPLRGVFRETYLEIYL